VACITVASERSIRAESCTGSATISRGARTTEAPCISGR